MDVSKAGGIRHFMPNVGKDGQEKKTDFQKQLIQLSKKDDSLSKMAQQKSLASASAKQAASVASMNAVGTETTAADVPQDKTTISHTKRDSFELSSDKPATSPTGIYSLKTGEDGKAQIVTDETDVPEKSSLTEMVELAAEQSEEELAAAKEAEDAAEEQLEDPKAAGEDDEQDEDDKKERKDYGTIAEGDFHYKCDDPEHKTNPELHNDIECEKVAEIPTVRPATKAEAQRAGMVV